MKAYLVGGAVRDRLLGRPVGDRDWVVVGSSPEAMLAAGFQPVGQDFPVFLHPQTHEEYALARTERKSGHGYHGFTFHTSPEVTLEEDLARRDLTINAIAQADDGTLIDPWGGQADLQARVLRHVSPAFAEDPVRILRLARFAARFDDFSVAPDTLALMQQMVADGEADHLVAERVWQELSRGLMEAHPSRMFEVLRECGALQRLLPEVNRLWGVPQRAEYHPEIDTGVHLMMVLDMAARLQAPLPVRYACLGHDLGKGTTPPDVLPRHIGHEERSVRLLKPLSERLRVPTDCRELAEVVAREHGHIHQCLGFSAGALLRLLERLDAFRKPARLADILLACECDARGRLGLSEQPYPQAERLTEAHRAAQAVATAPIASEAQARGLKGPAIAQAIHEARTRVIEASLPAAP
ncbi:multifunctional CCA addition/repair protein [Aquabacterium lacunae]|uniref:Multifunctional CCA protein n=1 Tax=Aquabacterium lacunae TaxID=2528630 RepID=A0A4Q9GWI3_9BURK|nr:multifunctional CCA addition/repair protein [Aquabacterium lacunae]TBO29411.1 multifunctional CCA addition/repair protein [Aquabacterium lacunae]